MNPKFNEAQERLITSAQRIAGAYLLHKYGSAHLVGEPKVELTATEGPTSSSFVFSGKIVCYASDGLLNQVGVNMTVNSNDIEVDSEESIQSKIESAVNAQQEKEPIKASLDSFRLHDDGSKYLKVSHLDLNDANLGIVGKNEYASSTDKVGLLTGIIKDNFIDNVVSFTGEFKEPVIEINAKKKEDELVEDECKTCKESQSSCKCADLKPVQPKQSSWFNEELLKAADLDNIDYEPGRETSDLEVTASKPISIREDAPKARSTDYLVQAAQLEEQSDLNAQAKVEHEAANALLALLQGMGYGTAKIVESSRSNEGLDFMAAVDHAGTVKAVSIPVSVKEGKVVLPKKALISTLIAKGLDAKAKLMEQFDFDVLEKLAAIEEKVAYDLKEAEDILNEKPVVKTANEGKNTMFEGDTDTLTVQKHLLPNHEDLKVGDRVSDGTDQWEIVNTGGQQNSKGEGDSSLWTMKKCQAPERSDKEPKNKIPL